MDIDNAVIVVTGASSGIGAATARAAASHGARVVLAARRADRLDDLVSELGTAVAVPCDVTDQSQVDELVRSTVDAFGRIDVLVNNAGQSLIAPIGDIDLDDFRAILDLNLVAPLRVLQAVLPTMRVQRSGSVVNVGSGITLQPYPGTAAYAASKAGLSQLSAVARAELKESGITVSTVLPSLTRTDIYAAARGAHQLEDALDGAQSPDQVAEVILDLIRTGAPVADLVPVEYGGSYRS